MGFEVCGWENGGWDGMGDGLENFGFEGNWGDFAIADVDGMGGVGEGIEGGNRGYLSVVPGCDDSSGASLPVVPASSEGDLLPELSSTDFDFGSYDNFDMEHFEMGGLDIEISERDGDLRVGEGGMKFSPNNEAIPMTSSTTNPSLDTTPLSYQHRPSTSTSPNQSLSLSPPATKKAPSKSSGHVNTSKIEKRTKNTQAARRYRQKRVDQMAGLEARLKESEEEKEALRMRVARLEGEVEILRGLLKKG
ncbi:hypothetical protein HYFRA_00001934 [Hymenoscyphus fraxineus]|uniref:BZIP domain-containing protein n=1 Tax=Hymenoscyphus fraxineus TaxID=746836 RepID=A0A9N9KKY6_9HELO|nr:hypothetical protein HYFRA_00001934 [Hymenoscyphus fraxineus]